MLRHHPLPDGYVDDFGCLLFTVWDDGTGELL